MDYLFGYGSLLSPVSIARTVQRPVTMTDLLPARVRGFKRSWTAAADVIVTEQGVSRDYTALFLDLSTDHGMICNGVLLRVTDGDLARLDLRERTYQRISVQAEWNGGMVSAFTYMVPNEEKKRDGVVLVGYLKIVHQALLNYSKEFNQEFWSSTEEPAMELVSGDYIFQDVEQNRALGRR